MKELRDACIRRKLTVKVSKSKIMKIDSKKEGQVSVTLDDAGME